MSAFSTRLSNFAKATTEPHEKLPVVLQSSLLFINRTCFEGCQVQKEIDYEMVNI